MYTPQQQWYMQQYGKEEHCGPHALAYNTLIF